MSDPDLDAAAEKIAALIAHMPEDNRRRRRVWRVFKSLAPESDAINATEAYVWLRARFNPAQIKQCVRREIANTFDDKGDAVIPPGLDRHGRMFTETVRFCQSVAYLARVSYAHRNDGGGMRELIGAQAESARQSRIAQTPRGGDRLQLAIEAVLRSKGMKTTAKEVLTALDSTLIVGQTANDITWKPNPRSSDTRTLRRESFETRVSRAKQNLH